MPYTPTNAKKMSELSTVQIRLGLMGASKTGKTFSALTFPNPVVIDIDNNLTAHKHRIDVLRLPFNDPEWLKSWYKQPSGVKFPIAGAVLSFLKSDQASKLDIDNTLIIDSWTTLQQSWDQQRGIEQALTKNGSVNEFAFWTDKIDFSLEVVNLLKTLKCHVVVCFHEQDQKDTQGNVIGKLEPLMQGKFVKQLQLHFTDFFRTVAKSKLDPIDKKTIIGTDYFWQTGSTNDVNLGGRQQLPMFIEPHYKIFNYNKVAEETTK